MGDRKKSGVVFGVCYDENLNLIYEQAHSLDKLEKFRGSKYLEANLNGVYKKVQKLVETGRYVLFVGLPCKVAGLLCYLGYRPDNLLTVDLLCHGTPSNKFHKEHLNYLCHKYNMEIKDVNEIRHRTNVRCDFILGNNKGMYVKECEYSDEYIVAFVNGLTNRESCYKCKFASVKRVGDITLGDFWGLGKYGTPFYHLIDYGVNLVLINNIKALGIMEEVQDYIWTESRELKEALVEQGTLKYPTHRPDERTVFLEEYKKTKNFELSVRKAFSRYLSKDYIIQCKLSRGINELKNFIKRKIGAKNTEKIKQIKHKLSWWK